MLKKIGIALAAVLALLAIVIATRPAAFRIERSAVVAAPPEVVYGHVNMLQRWQGWSPWEGMDPNLKRTYAGPATGVGASYTWAGNDKVGEGSMTITASDPARKVVIKLEFRKPWKATNDAIFTFAPQADGTLVTWAMEGENDFFGKAAWMVMDMDRMVGADFERGLLSLKDVSEGEVRRRAAEAAMNAAQAQTPAAK